MENQIKWNEIRTGTGYANTIPQAVNNLVANNEEQRKKAYSEIDDNVIIYGTLYEACYYIIEPIVELLEGKYTVDRTYPLRVLAEIALGRTNPNEKMVIQGVNREIGVMEACRERLKELKERIEGIIIQNEKEKDEKEVILEKIHTDFPPFNLDDFPSGLFDGQRLPPSEPN